MAHPAGVQLQAARLLPLVRRAADVADGSALGGPCLPHVPVRQWVRVCQLRLPIPRRVLLVAQPELVTPVLQVVQRVVERHLLGHTEIKSDEGQGGAVTLIQRFGSAANLNIHGQDFAT
jgi:hypothetical protein